MSSLREHTEAILGLSERVAKARTKLGKKPGDVSVMKANCPMCNGEQSVVISSDGKRMFRLMCSTQNCLRAIG